MYQAMQNGCWGLGAISGASIGGAIADKIGWRWCFLLQLPFSLSALTIGILAVQNQPGGGVVASSLEAGLGAVWKRIDFSGAVVLVMGVSVQLVGLSMGGNELPWSSPWVLGALVTSFVLMGVFLVIESRTTAIPMIPLRMLKGRLPIATQIANICAGFAAFGVRSFALKFLVKQTLSRHQTG
jgi:MFS family permease